MMADRRNPNHDDNDDDDEAWAGRYFTGGAPPQPFHVLIPENPPPILTKRLCLRHLRLEDVEGIFAFQSRPEHLGVAGAAIKDITIEHTKDWIASKTYTEPPLAAGRSYAFTIVRRDDPTEKIIGTLAVNRVVPVPNIGYGLDPDMWGKKYATEALAALLEAWWALPRERVQQENVEVGEEREKVFAGCNMSNIRSFRVLQKCGFQIYREHVYADGEHACVAVLEMPGEKAAVRN